MNFYFYFIVHGCFYFLHSADEDSIDYKNILRKFMLVKDYIENYEFCLKSQLFKADVADEFIGQKLGAEKLFLFQVFFLLDIRDLSIKETFLGGGSGDIINIL
uniref:Uncharacterized protein n=1 Tax=Rhizophagus irregularis (strain DAOM 181602 / DAOM 197198 / MUCL 43194) TaxID=747089 RepID=U9TIJ8_RHIID